MNKYKKILLIIIAAVMLFSIVAYIAFDRGWFGQHLFLFKTDFTKLPGWYQDDHSAALATLQKSCLIIAKKDPQKLFSNSMLKSRTFGDWQKICLAIDQVDKNDMNSARKFFEHWFKPYQVYNNFNAKGLFTGYYLPTLKCSFTPDERYTAPIYAIPDDWVKVDLGMFDEKLKGKTIVGQVKNNSLRRYPDRAAITKGAISEKAKVLVWCEDQIDVFFAQIQGSAIVQLSSEEPDFWKVLFLKNFEQPSTMCKQTQFLVGYEGSNGRSYTSIGKVLIKNNELTSQHSSMQDIRAWLIKNPAKIDSILNQNASYVFFRILENDAPLGSQQIPLTQERSLAVDKRYIPLGAPLWLDTITPDDVPLRRLLIAQDTGGAIKGIIRGDVYWGAGDKAAFIAGNMKSKGKYWILLPKF